MAQKPKSTNCREYYSLYCELYWLIDSTYKSSYLLKEYDHYNTLVQQGEMKLPKCSVEVLKHICDLLKYDMGLTLWKLFDRDTDSNTLETLKCFLMSQYGKKPNYCIDKQTKKIIENLKDIRNEFLAHTGKDKSVSKITVPVLRHALDEARNYLNALCFPDIDSRVSPLDDSRIYTMGLDMQLGLALLMQGANLTKGDKNGDE